MSEFDLEIEILKVKGICGNFLLFFYVFRASNYIRTPSKNHNVIGKENNEMCAITFLKACTLSRISSARVTFYIQNCFCSELLKKKNFPSAKLKKIMSRNFQVSL